MTAFIPTADPSARRLRAAIVGGDLDSVRAVLLEHPALATAYIGSPAQARTCLHLATDHPGHYPEVAATIGVLVAAGADVDAPFVGPHRERPLHWAASSNDVAALEALVAAGADVEVSGGVLTDGPPLDDAVIFKNLDAARALVAHGATTRLFHAAALGLTARLVALLERGSDRDEYDAALWHACANGQREAAARLLAAGADPDFRGFADTSTRAAAAASGDEALIALLAHEA